MNIQSANGQPIAVGEFGPARAFAVEEQKLGRSEAAQTDAFGMASEEAEDCGEIGAGHAQIAAGHRSDQEIDLIEIVGHAPSALMHLQAHHGQIRYCDGDRHETTSPSLALIPESAKKYQTDFRGRSGRAARGREAAEND